MKDRISFLNTEHVARDYKSYPCNNMTLPGIFKASKTLDAMPSVNITGRNPIPPVPTMKVLEEASARSGRYYPITVYVNKDGQRLDEEMFPTDEALRALERRKVVSFPDRLVP